MGESSRAFAPAAAGPALVAHETTSSSPVQLRLLGRPTLVSDASSCRLATQKSLALLTYLAVKGRPVPRVQLAALLWPDSDPDRARRSLRGELARLRSALPVGAIDGSRHEIWLDMSQVETDLDLFHEHMEEQRDLEALQLVQGEFCEGLDVRGVDPFDEWLHEQRTLLKATHVRVLHRFIRTARENADPKSALEWATRGIEGQPLDEEFYVQAMSATDELGDRSGALELYRRLGHVLQEELGISPSPEARAVAKRISQGGTLSNVAGLRLKVGADPTDFIGRDQERNVILRCEERTSKGTGSLVFVHGTAGVGKSRLVREAIGQRRSIWCRAQRPASKVAYLPIARGLREYLASWGVPPVPELWLREAARICPDLSRAGRNTSLGAPEDKVRLIEGLSETLVGAAGPSGVVVFDDAEAADSETIAVIGALLSSLVRLRVTVILIARTDLQSLPAPLADLVVPSTTMTHFTDVRLEELDQHELRNLVRSCLRSNTAGTATPAWVDEFADLVFQVLGGNPFSAIECTRLAFDRSEQSPSDLLAAIKTGIPDVVRARIAALPEKLRRVTEAAATLGELMRPDVIGRMLTMEAWELAEALDELVARRILVSRNGITGFTHPLLAEIVFESLPPARRQLLHAKAAEALADAHSLSLDQVSGRIAAHLEAAGQGSAAVPYHERAAENAARSHAHHNAIHHFQRLRELTPRQRQVPLLLRLGEVLSYGETRPAEEVYREALALAVQQGAGREQAQCFLALGMLLRRRADLRGSRTALSEALRRFQMYQDREGMERALEALTYAHIQEGCLSAARTTALKAAETAGEGGRISHVGSAQLSLGVAHLYGGAYVQALTAFEKAQQIAVVTRNELAEAESLRYLSAVYGADGRLGTPAQAWTAAERAIEICLGMGHRMGLARAADGMGGAYLVQRDWHRALDCYVAGLSLKQSVGYVWGFDAMVYRVGYTFLQAGETESAGHVLHHARSLSRKLKAPYWLCRTLIAMAELCRQTGEPTLAEEHATEALKLAESLQHRDFIVAARAIAIHASPQGPARAPHGRRPGRPAAPTGPGAQPTLPDLPACLIVPTRGHEEIVSWLDLVVEDLLGSIR